MDHAQASEQFSDFLDGTLPARDKAALEQHLAACIQCRTELESFRRALGSLGKL
jgi:anti-sigma factor RsiW